MTLSHLSKKVQSITVVSGCPVLSLLLSMTSWDDIFKEYHLDAASEPLYIPLCSRLIYSCVLMMVPSPLICCFGAMLFLLGLCRGQHPAMPSCLVSHTCCARASDWQPQRACMEPFPQNHGPDTCTDAWLASLSACINKACPSNAHDAAPASTLSDNAGMIRDMFDNGGQGW